MPLVPLAPLAGVATHNHDTTQLVLQSFFSSELGINPTQS